MGNSFQIGKLFGISIRIDATWFVIFALIAWTLGSHYFPQFYPNWNQMIYWIMAVLTAIIFFASVVAHELAHSLVSKARGVPVRSITLFIFGGVAEITDEPKKPASEFWMAIAGPLTSIAIAIIFGGFYFLAGRSKTPFSAMSLWLSGINMTIAVFNLIPGFPLDGGRVLRSIIWRITGNIRSATRVASIVGRIVAYLFILWGIYRIFFNNDIFGGIWIAFIGWFLENAASSSYRQLALKEALQGVRVRDVMMSDCPRLAYNLTIRELVDTYILHSNHQCFPVINNETVIGIITIQSIKEVPRESWESVMINEIMIPLTEMISVSPDEEVFSVLQKMAISRVSQIPVIQEGQLVGMISRDSLINIINLKT